MGIHLENIYQELEMSSAYVDSHRDISSVCEIVQPHSHSFFELILCCGCDHVQYLLGSQRYRLQKGDVIFIPPGISHAPLFPEQMHKPYERIVVWINAELLAQFCQNWNDRGYATGQLYMPYLLRTAGTYWESPIADAFQRGCSESLNRHPGWEAAMYGNATILLTLLNRALLSNQKPPPSEHAELLDELLRYVEEHLTEKNQHQRRRAASSGQRKHHHPPLQKTFGCQFLPLCDPAAAGSRQTIYAGGNSLGANCGTGGFL